VTPLQSRDLNIPSSNSPKSAKVENIAKGPKRKKKVFKFQPQDSSKEAEL